MLSLPKPFVTACPRRSTPTNQEELEHGKRKLLQLGALPISMIIGLRSVTKNIRGSLLIVLISALSTAVLVFGFLFVYSIASIHGTIAKWGYDSADLSIRIDNPAKNDFLHSFRKKFSPTQGLTITRGTGMPMRWCQFLRRTGLP
ncbi:hypothetical protein ACFTAO_33860 [Paenibacillus rhizoplanae]